MSRIDGLTQVMELLRRQLSATKSGTANRGGVPGSPEIDSSIAEGCWGAGGGCCGAVCRGAAASMPAADATASARMARRE